MNPLLYILRQPHDHVLDNYLPLRQLNSLINTVSQALSPLHMKVIISNLH